MVYSLALDALLLLIIALLIPIGMYRGGLREVCASAGLLLGIQIAQLWSVRWGDWLADITNMDQGVARFIVAVSIVVFVTGAIGYGAGASFASSPGPGGRVYGGLIALANGIVFLGALIQFVVTYLNDGSRPAIVADSYFARAVSGGFDRVLLVVTVIVLLAILFGMIVRERDPGEAYPDIQPAQSPAHKPQAATTAPVQAATTPVSPVTPEAAAASAPAAAVKVRQVRHWEEVAPSSTEELQKGWSRTWPTTVSKSQPARTERPRPSSAAAYPIRRPVRPKDEDVLREWLEEEGQPPAARPTRARPDIDE